MNANKQNINNNNDHFAKLEIFFQKKIDQEKINRKIKQNKKVSKKRKENILSFEFDSNQFRLVDKNGVASLSAMRIGKKNSVEQEEKNNTLIENNKRQILKNKYELLFEYQDIENYTNIYKDVIEPLEELNKKEQSIVDAIQSEEKLEIGTFNSSRDNIKMEIDAYKELLHNTENQNKADRHEMITGYIEKQSELYTLSKEYYINSERIKEMNTKLK